MKIKNVIFDFGQVMVRFEPSYMVGKYVTDKDDAKLLEEVVFDRLYWDKLDKGTITNEKTLEECRKRLPERLWEVADTIYYNWIYNIPDIEGMHELTVYLKEKYGVKIYLLSNISKYFAENSHKIECLKNFDGLIMTGPIGIVKPTAEIFEYMCNKFDIQPEECVFIDDNRANIAGASAYGLCTYLFSGNVEKLKDHLDFILS